MPSESVSNPCDVGKPMSSSMLLLEEVSFSVGLGVFIQTKPLYWCCLLILSFCSGSGKDQEWPRDRLLRERSIKPHNSQYWAIPGVFHRASGKSGTVSQTAHQSKPRSCIGHPQDTKMAQLWKELQSWGAQAM